MSFEIIYRASVYVMMFLAALVLSVDATSDCRIAMLYPVLVALAGAIAFLTVDRRPSFGLSRKLANALALGSIILCWIEYNIDGSLLLSLAHWLVYFVLIKTFLPKTIEDDWWLLILSVMQVLVGTVVSQSDIVGICLFGWVLSGLWVLALFYLHREALRQRAGGTDAARPANLAAPIPVLARSFAAGPQQAETPLYPGLFDLPYLFASLRVLAITLALGSIIFLAMPRRNAVGKQGRTGAPAKHLTGFGDEIQLGQLGEILENDSIVLSIETFDVDGNRVQLKGEPLWRGVTMVNYENGRWQRVRVTGRDPSFEARRAVPPEQLLRQRIKLEPTDTNALFGLRPILEASTRDQYQPQINPIDGSLIRPELRPGSYDYEVWSATTSDVAQPVEGYPDPFRFDRMRHIAEPLKSRLRAIAEPQVAHIPAANIVERAQALEAYLRDSGKFGYTLQMDVVDATLDPVEDFLINRRQGHCAYFASALTLLLRSIDIPARMVNGFKGGDWNELAGVITVREKHAHSWVEALVNSRRTRYGEELPVWLELDPTPSEARDESVAKVGGVSPNVRLFSDFIRFIWVFYVAGFDAERQERLVYKPIKDLVTQASRGFRMIAAWLSQAFHAVFRFPDVASFFSIRGFLVSFVTLLLVAALG
ncbi:MAG TPA: DUF3488 and transglutaminase-like domain-containing protein, partial [Isosphaeraceae bacterium]|nr:DUF3488 and transglutaminase-like domain-containing protein [Isosphaeraceae bacterium]